MGEFKVTASLEAKTHSL